MEAATWKSEDADLIAWFQEETNLPLYPFRLKQGSMVTDCDKFYSSLRTDIKEGPKAPRMLFGGLRSDLKALQEVAKKLKYEER